MPMTIEAIARNVPLSQRSDDAAYWRSVPAWERLAALEAIRREYHRWKQDAEPRLQRVCTIGSIADLEADVVERRRHGDRKDGNRLR